MLSKKIGNTLVLSFIFTLSLQSFANKTILVSDIDDTIKATGVNAWSSIWHKAPSTINEFAEMSVLYNSWYENNKSTGNIYYLTAAPNIVDILGIQFLEASNFPPVYDNVGQHVISGRDPLVSSGTFKTGKLIEIFNTEQPDTMILIGDNGEQDIIAYGNIIKYIKKIKSQTKIYAYIHHVYEAASKSLPIPKNQIAFLTSADLAVHFYNNNWISKNDLLKNLNQVVYDSDPRTKLTETVVPSFMECKKFNSWPQISSIISDNSELSGIYSQIQSNLQTLCN